MFRSWIPPMRSKRDHSRSVRCCRLHGKRTAALRIQPLEPRLALTTLPTGFGETLITTDDNLTRPTAMEFSPSGQLWVLQQTGAAKIVNFNTGGTHTAGTLTVDSRGERGLLGIAFDSQYDGAGPNVDLVYLYYTATTPNAHNRLSRFVVNNAGSTTPSIGAETIIMEIAPEPQGDGSSNHNGGAIHFGVDGNLYIAIGDHNADGSSFRGGNHVSQRLDSQHGKILRIDVGGDDFPSDPNRNYAIPAGNPFIDASPSTFDEIWALGLRNPYTFAVQPESGLIFINDVGEQQWEEINQGAAGANYGWASEQTPGGFAEGFEATAPAYATVGTYANPAMAYDHSNSLPSPSGCAITGGVFYPSDSQFGDNYAGSYFFADFCGNFIRVFDPASPGSAGTPDTSAGFATSLTTGGPIDLKVDADGNLYYLARGGPGAIYRISLDVPVITDQPDDVTVTAGQSASFSVTADGPAPLGFQWQRADSATPTTFINIPAATSASFTLANVQAVDDGDLFRVVVTNATGSATSDAAALTVDINIQPPTITSDPGDQTVAAGDSVTLNVTASGTAPLSYQWQRADNATPNDFIDIPGATSSDLMLTDVQQADNGDQFRAFATNVAGSAISDAATIIINQTPSATMTATPSYAFGDTISFSATATDPEDGALPASAYQWTVDFGHRTHFHPHVAPIVGITSGTFVADFIEPDPLQSYRIFLDVTDSSGAVFTTFFDVQPEIVSLTLESVPISIPLAIDGGEVDSPQPSVIGSVRAIHAPVVEAVDGTFYEFVSWSDGGAAVHTIATPSSDTTYQAQFQISPLTLSIDDSSISEGAGLMATLATVTRGTDTTDALTVRLNSDDTSEANVPATVTIPAGQASANFDIDAVDDVDIDGTQTIVVTASADGHADGTMEIEVVDAETWQNPFLREDTNFDGQVTGLDALIIINELSRRQFSDRLSEELISRQDPPLEFYDTNNDGSATTLDALLVINYLGIVPLERAEPEFTSPAADNDLTDDLLTMLAQKDYEHHRLPARTHPAPQRTLF